MRLVRKGAPPANVSTTRGVTYSWEQARRALLEDLATCAPDKRAKCAKGHFDKLDKSVVGRALYAEQRGLCVFCEAALRLGDQHRVTNIIIAHYVPRSRRPDLALDWSNLYASCDRPHTCDRKQRSTCLCLRPPHLLDFGRLLSFDRQGRVAVSADAASRLRPANPDDHGCTDPACPDELTALERILATDGNSPLNLNHKVLIAARRAALDGLRKHLTKHHGRAPTRAERQAWAERVSQDDRLPRHWSAQEQWLNGR